MIPAGPDQPWPPLDDHRPTEAHTDRQATERDTPPDLLMPENCQWIADEVIDAELFLADLITTEFHHDPRVPAADLRVTVQNGVIILHGRVPTAEARAAALRRARNIPGVFDVCCTLAVDNEAQP